MNLNQLIDTKANFLTGGVEKEDIIHLLRPSRWGIITEVGKYYCCYKEVFKMSIISLLFRVALILGLCCLIPLFLYNILTMAPPIHLFEYIFISNLTFSFFVVKYIGIFCFGRELLDKINNSYTTF